MTTSFSKALVIDRHKPICELIAAILRSAGFSSLTSYSITQAQARLEAGKFDLVFADYQTARNREAPISPLLLAKIKARNPEAKIVLMSDNFPDGPLSDYPFLPKPFTYRELLGKCEMLRPETARVTPVKTVSRALEPSPKTSSRRRVPAA